MKEEVQAFGIQSIAKDSVIRRELATIGKLINHQQEVPRDYICEIEQKKAKVKFDSGADRCFINTTWANQLGLRVDVLGEPFDAISAEGIRTKVTRVVRELRIRIGPVQFRVDAFLYPVKSYGLILGLSWFQRYNPNICWKSGIIQIGDKSIYPRKMHHQNEEVLAVTSKMRKPKTVYVLNQKNVNEIEEPEIVKPLLKEFKEVFTDELNTLPPVRDIEHEIRPTDDVPIAQQPYRMSPVEADQLQKLTKELLDKKFIVPSKSPWAAPVLFVKKKDGGLRMCVDYRKLNAVTVRNNYPLPRIDDLLDRLSGSKFFSKIDLCSGYYQIWVEANSQAKTAFGTHQGHYEFTVMPFGLTNAPPTFMQLMNSVFQEFLNQFIIIYLDGILIFSTSMEDHVKHLRTVLEVLQQHKLFAKRSKCTFMANELVFLGYKICEGKIYPDPEKVSCIQRLCRPHSLTEVKAFLGIVNFYRKFIQDCAEKSSPLTDLLRGNAAFKWGSREEEAFECLKRELIKNPCLFLPDFSKSFIITTDASCLAIGVVLGQFIDNHEHPIAYFSRRLNDAQSNYPAHELELPAILQAIRHWRCHGKGQKFMIKTDHMSLKYIFTQKNVSRKCWLQNL